MAPKHDMMQCMLPQGPGTQLSLPLRSADRPFSPGGFELMSTYGLSPTTSASAKCLWARQPTRCLSLEGAVTGPAVLQPRMPGDAVPEAVPGCMPTDLLTSMPSGQTRQQGLLVR